MPRLSRYRLVTTLVCAGLAGLAAGLWPGPTGADGRLLDALVKARAGLFPRTADDASSPVSVVALDARTLRDPELAPYPRTFLAPVWATVLDGLFQAGATAVGFDIIFAYSANRFRADFDAPFLAALGRFRDRVVLGRSLDTPPAPPFQAALLNEEQALGATELIPDPDGIYRRIPLMIRTADGPVLSLAGAVLRRAGRTALPDEVVLAPTRHLERIPTYALIDVLRCARDAPTALAPAFGGRIVLIGTTLPEEDRRVASDRFLAPAVTDSVPLHPCGLHRLGASARSSTTIPGVFLFAGAIEAVATSRVTQTAPPGLVATAAAGMAAVGSLLGLVVTPWAAAAFVALGGVGLGGGAVVALAGDVWIPIAWPLATLVASPWVGYVVRYLVEERTRQRIQRAFSHYLSPAVVDRLTADPGALRLGGELREVTIMFADLSGFTAMSGTLTPEALNRLTNEYLGYIVEQVERTGGYVDKFIGDAVMAMWGAPAPDLQHATHAIQAARDAVARIRAEGDRARARGERAYSVKIGLNSGPVVVGNVGTERRYNYTAVGETVNVASRLEGVPGFYGCQVVIGPRTAELARDDFVLRELDTIRVKGRDSPLTIFEPLVERSAADPEVCGRAARYAEALAHYRAMRFLDAHAIWEPLAEEESVLTAEDGARQACPPSRMADRARAFATAPPGRSWDGVWVLTSK